MLQKVFGISKALETGKAGIKSRGNDDSDEKCEVDPQVILCTQDSDQKCKVDPQVILRTHAAISFRLSDAGKPNEEDSPSNGRAKSAVVEHINTQPAIVIHKKKWTDGSVPLDSVSKELKRLGQYPMPTIEWFFVIYDEVLKSARTAESIDRICSPAVENVPSGKSNFSIRVETTLTTDLQIVNFLTDHNITPASTPNKNELLKWQSIRDALQPNMELKSARDWTRGVRENIELSQKLQTEMQSWFLRFIEESLDAGFRVFGECSGGRGKSLNCSSVAAVLSNLKRVNDLLDRVGLKPNGIFTEKIDRLKRKIYGFVIKHVGSTYDNCTPNSSQVLF